MRYGLCFLKAIKKTEAEKVKVLVQRTQLVKWTQPSALVLMGSCMSTSYGTYQTEPWNSLPSLSPWDWALPEDGSCVSSFCISCAEYRTCCGIGADMGVNEWTSVC